MATKAQLEGENKILTGKVEALEREVTALHRRIKEMQRTSSHTVSPISSCINCGQEQAQILTTETGYRCPLCGHDWTDEHERAAFRR